MFHSLISVDLEFIWLRKIWRLNKVIIVIVIIIIIMIIIIIYMLILIHITMLTMLMLQKGNANYRLLWFLSCKNAECISIWMCQKVPIENCSHLTGIRPKRENTVHFSTYVAEVCYCWVLQRKLNFSRILPPLVTFPGTTYQHLS